MKLILNIILILIVGCSCHNPEQETDPTPLKAQQKITPGAERTEEYLHLIKDRKVGLIVNQTSTVGSQHLIDHLVDKGINVVRIFTPEHGFKGDADAGEKIDNCGETYRSIPIKSLYGDTKQPQKEDVDAVDILMFDIQDVGVRFYTYISTLHYVMQSSADYNTPLIVLDRPNPLASYVDGPVLEPEFKSFVGMHPVPVVYGLTIGEYAHMINGENWLSNNAQSELTVIKVDNYNHHSNYVLPINPSPNLPNTMAIRHYPSLCFFEGTTVSVGRGTDAPFQQIGHPDYVSDYTFTPVSGPGSKYPKHENTQCAGIDLSRVAPPKSSLDISYLIDFYKSLKSKDKPFFNENNFFDLLAGSDNLRKMILEGKSEVEIRSLWEPGLLEYKMMRRKYLLYNPAH